MAKRAFKSDDAEVGTSSKVLDPQNVGSFGKLLMTNTNIHRRQIFQNVVTIFECI